MTLKIECLLACENHLGAASRRLHRDVLAVALANKLARIAWSVLAGERNYQARRTAA